MKPPLPVDQIIHRVTYHAVTRYVQRILGIIVPVSEDTTQRMQAAIHCKKARTSIDEVRAIILIPKVAVAIENNFSGIDTRNFTAILCPKNQIVVTILAPQPHMKTAGRFGRAKRSGALLSRIADRISLQVKGITPTEQRDEHDA